jgi:hypothetical protein
MSEKRFAAAVVWSSEPKNSQAFRPAQMGDRRARSL